MAFVLPLILTLVGATAIWQAWRLNDLGWLRISVIAGVIFLSLGHALWLLNGAAAPAPAVQIGINVGYAVLLFFVLWTNTPSIWYLSLFGLIVAVLFPAEGGFLLIGVLGGLIIYSGWAEGRGEIEFPQSPFVNRRGAERFEEDLDRNRIFLALLNEGVVIANPTGAIIFVNHAATQILDMPTGEMIGESIMTVLSRLPMVTSTAEGMFNSQLTPFEFNGRMLEGRMHIVSSETDGSHVGLMAILRDVSATYQAEGARQLFLARVTDNLRTPLTNVQGYSDLLRNKQATQDTESFINAIDHNVERMVRLVNSLIFLAESQADRIDVGDELADIRQIVPQVVKQLAPHTEEQAVEVKIRLGDELVPIQMRATHLRSLIYELASNALRFTPEAGYIQISARFVKIGEFQDTFVLIDVEDSGVGISAERQRAIFDAFYSYAGGADGQPAHLGIGLTIVKALVEGYGGRIWVSNRESGQSGSRFSCLIPAAQPKRPFSDLHPADVLFEFNDQD